MKMIDISEFVRNRLVAMGISSEVAQRVTAGADLATEESDDAGIDPRESIALTYPFTKGAFTRMKEAAITNMPAGGLVKMLENPVKVATFLDQGMRATPASLRLELPAWVHEKSEADRNRQAMARARRLAEGKEAQMSASQEQDASGDERDWVETPF